MLVYRIEGVVRKCLCRDENDRKAVAEMKHKYANRSEQFNSRLDENGYIFITDISEGILTLGAIVCDLEKISVLIDSYVKHLEIQLSNIVITEITLKKLNGLLNKATRQNYIQDDDEILEEYGLEDIVGRYSRYLEYEEYIVKKCTSDVVQYNENKYWMSDTFRSELQRIFKGSSGEAAIGHPVHYIIETDDDSTRRIMQTYLLRSLYAQNRLRSARFSCVEIEPNESLKDAPYEMLYKASFGGSIVVRLLIEEDSEETNYASELNEKIQIICKMLKRYRNQVLTVICLPKECKQLKEQFYEELSNISIVELQENFMKGKTAETFLQKLAEEKMVSADRKLISKIQDGKGYLAPELRYIFEEWYAQKLKTVIYPQYQCISAISAEEMKSAPKGSAYERLQQMVGITPVKQVIDKALDYHKLQKLYREKGMKPGQPAMHMVFSGNPGTAKTTVARLFAQIMQDNGLLSRGHLVEVGRSDLVGKYVGWTAKCVKQKFKDARGGVLFIDEAYSLVEDRAGSYGDEAINTIVQEMENHREDLVVIFAGYPDRMEEFIQKNPGLRSRIAFHVSFPDYNEWELCQIAQLMGKERGIEFTKEAMGKLRNVFRHMRKRDDFGNGRYVRSMLEQAQMNQAGRLLKRDISSITDKELFTITAEDIEIPIMEREERRVIGFAC